MQGAPSAELIRPVVVVQPVGDVAALLDLGNQASLADGGPTEED